MSPDPDMPAAAGLVGAHFSTSKGLDQAVYTAKDLGCAVLQLFTKNGRTWKEKDLTSNQADTFCKARQAADITWVLSHCTYLINIASNDKDKLEKSRAALLAEMERSAALGIDYVVLHPGSHMGRGEEKGLETAAESLNRVLSKRGPSWPMLLLETTAGQGTNLGHAFEQFAFLLDRLDRPAAAGVCLDTSHMFAAGYDISGIKAYDQTMATLEKIIGLNRVHAIHVNDSKAPLGSRKDRHEHIGKGCIGTSGFELIMADQRLSHLPKILETPKELDKTPMDPVNLALLRRMIPEHQTVD